MSSSTSGDTTQGSDPGLQLAPSENDLPDFALLKKSFEDTVNNLQSFSNQCDENFNIRYSIWPGQSADGRKHAREGAKIDPTPWDGASDLQVPLCDEAINSKVAMLSMAFRRSSISATPVEGNDIKRSKTVSNFMRWLVQTQIPGVQREVSLLCNYIQQMGIGAIGTFWEERQEKILATVTIEQLGQMFQGLDIQNMIYSDDVADDLIAIFEEQYGCTRAKAKKILQSLRDTGKATVPTLGRKLSYPVIRAFDLNHNLFIPQESTDEENASGMYRVEYMTAEQIRALVNTAGWDSDWAEAVIKTCKGKLITMTNNEYNQPVSRSFMYQESRFTNLIGVCYAYQKLSDEDGYSGIYCTIFNPLMPPSPEQDGYAKHGLLGYADGEYPFTIFRREHLSRKLHDTRGIPEPGKPFQQQIKVHKDSLIDAASLAICPPMMYPQGRPPLKWGAGARIPERRPGEYHFADRPVYDPSTEKSQAQLQADFNRYCGFVGSETDNQFAALKNQEETDAFLSKFSEVFQKVWSRYKQFGSEEVYFRVVGVKQTEPIAFHKGQDDEEFDFMLKFSLDSLDPDKTFAKLEQIAKIVATADRDGVVNYSEWLSVMINAVDPNIAEQIIDPVNEGQARIVSQMQDKFAKIFAGQEQDIPTGTPPQLGQQILQNYVQGDPVVQRRLQDKSDPFGERLMRMQKQLQLAGDQVENAAIGKLGTAPAKV